MDFTNAVSCDVQSKAIQKRSLSGSQGPSGFKWSEFESCSPFDVIVTEESFLVNFIELRVLGESVLKNNSPKSLDHHITL